MTPLSRSRPSALLALLLGGILLLAGLFAYEAISALRQREAATVRTLRDYAAIASWELVARTSDALALTLREVFDPVTGSPAASPYDRLPSLDPVARAADSLLPCGSADEAGESAAFSLDLRDASLVVNGAIPASRRIWLVSAVADNARTAYQANQRFALIDGVPGAPQLILAYGVKRVQYGAFPQAGAPLAVFGILRCRSAFGAPLVERVLRSRRLLPFPVSAGLANDSLLAITLMDDAGAVRLNTAEDGLAELAQEVVLETPAALHARVALRSGAVARLAVAPPSAAARLPWLVALLGLTAAMAFVAIRQLRRELELARLRSDFISSVSHELRTPLAQILLSGETLVLERARTPEEQVAVAGVVVQEARRLIRMVENVLSFARLERGGHVVDPRPTRLAPLLRGILTPWLQTVEGRVRVATQFDESAWASVDGGGITQVLHNLLDNAVKYGPAGQTIRVTLDSQPDLVRVGVEDEGPGVAEADIARIWEPFVRARHAASGGTGLGLAVVRDLIQAHGGQVAVERSGRGGARFSFTLPGCIPPSVAPTPSEALVRGR